MNRIELLLLRIIAHARFADRIGNYDRIAQLTRRVERIAAHIKNQLN